MSKHCDLPVPRLICFGAARRLTMAGSGHIDLETAPNVYWDDA